MDNEVITKKSWWNTNWRWALPLSALALVAIGILFTISEVNATKEEREHGIAFDQVKWKEKDDRGYAYRNKMIRDLIADERLKKLEKEQVIDLLGLPDRIDNKYLFYRISQERLGSFPLHTTTLVLKLSEGDTVKSVMIHE
jgi:hypothetical protein